MSRKLVGWGGVAAAGGAAYYLYSAGGSPKLAEKQFEHDAATAARKIKGDYPGQDKEAKKAAEEGYENLRAKAQDLSEQAKVEARKAEQIASKKFEDARAETNQAINKFDRDVEQKASNTKSWLGSWFGGK